MKVLYVIMILFLIPAIEMDYCHIMCVSVVRVSGGDESIIAAGGNESISAAGGKGSVIVTGILLPELHIITIMDAVIRSVNIS